MQNKVRGTVARDFDEDFFIPIDSPDLGDGLLRGVNFVRRAFYALSPILQIGAKALFRVWNWSRRVSMKKMRETVSFTIMITLS